MVLIGAHTFAWSPGITDAELDPLFAELTGTAIDFVELASYDLEGLTPAAIRRVSTASGLKFADFKVGYHEGRLAEVPAPRHRNAPVELPADYAAVRDAVRRGLDDVTR